MNRLANKVIAVIGGTSGLGLASAKAFVGEGARLVVVGPDADGVAAAEKSLGSAVCGVVGDATDPSTAPAAIRRALEAFGGLDGMFHVAGGSGRRQGDGPVHAITDNGWSYTLNLNLTSLFYSNRAAAEHWVQAKRGGAVLNMGSVLGFSPAPKHFATHAYAAAKAAVVGLTQSAAAFYAPHHIRFNVLAPALVTTPMSHRAQNDPAILDYLRRKQPLAGGPMTRPEEISDAAVFLLSDEARFVTGQVLAVDAGWCVSEAD